MSHGPRLFKLINVRNNEIWEIQTQNLDMIVSIVMSQFHRKQDKESDDAFLSSAKVCSSTSVRFEWELSDYKGCEEWFRSTEDIIAQQQHQQHDSSGIENDCDVLLRWDGETTKRSLVPRGGSLEPLTKRQRCSASIVAGRSAETAIEIDLD